MSDLGHVARALCLLSGGLDSQLAVCVLREQGLHVEGVVFDSPFFSLQTARRASEALDLPLRVVNFTPDIVRLLEAPPHGFGSEMNPCIDCHAHMLRRAGERLAEWGFDFLATGEVLNERPMSQNRQSLGVVERDSGFADLVLRPLSARLLPPTRPEREGWVDRERLLALQGRGRKPQLALARRYGLTFVPSPAGGCRLTEPGYCRRLRDLKAHEGIHGERSLNLLRVGRHLRLDGRTKLIVGRDQHDNVLLEGTVELYDLLLRLEEIPGPSGLLPNTAGEEHIRLAASICARYAGVEAGCPVTVRVRSSRGVRNLQVPAAEPGFCERLLV